MDNKLKEHLVDRFFRYLSISSQSRVSSRVVPSSKGQMLLARLLARELKELGLKSVVVNDNAIVTAYLPANVENTYSIGFLSHIDTVDIGESEDIYPQVFKFHGSDIILNKKKNIIFKISEHKEIKKYLGDDIIFSDGTSVLGCDNKAAIAIIMTALKYIKDLKLPHGDIFVAFVPDEEIGLRGSKLLDIKKFSPDFAYTIDGSELGEVSQETFNASKVHIEIEGVVTDFENAKDKMINPVLIAVDIVKSFDRRQTPEYTSEKEGFIWTTNIIADGKIAKIDISIRDHDKKLFDIKKAEVERAIERVKRQYRKAKIKYSMEDIYLNIYDNIKNNKVSIDTLYKALDNLKIKAKPLAMRGGTDGSALASKGIAIPNYFTGGHNFHSVYEFLPISSFYKSLETTLEIIRITSENKKII